MPGRLEGQVAWITGGASGMGEATAQLFAQEGAKVTVVDVQGDKGRNVADGIIESGGEAVSFECDVTSETQVRESIAKTAEHFGGLQIVVNCAGIVHVDPLHEHTDEDWDHVMNVNVKSIFYSTKYGLNHFRRSARSYMVNVGSISSFVAQALTPVYTTSKYAVLGLTRSIALDYAADGLRCNCVCPGITDTPMLREHLETTDDPETTLSGRLRRVPMGVALSPGEIAKSILYFSCEDSAGVTGTSLVIDCGYTTAAEWETSHTKFMEDS